jgi:hypothetical protein
MKADVAGTGIPFGITGTSSSPKFTPDVKGIAGGLLQGYLANQGTGANQQQQQQQDPIKSVSGLFGKKKQQPK